MRSRTAGGATGLRSWICILAVLGALSGCSAESAPGPPAVRGDAAAVERVLSEVLDALHDGNGARACAFYTDSYKRALVKGTKLDGSRLASGGVSCEQQVAELKPTFNLLVPGREMKVIRIAVRGDRATAVSEFDTTDGTTRVRELLVRQEGNWKIERGQKPGQAAPPTPATATATRRGRVWLVPLDQISRRLLVAASSSLQWRYRVEVRLLPRLLSGPRILAPDRAQLAATKLLSRLASGYPKRPGRRTVIGVTNIDIFNPQVPEWGFIFGLVHDEGYGVISTARMNPANLGRPADAQLVQDRLTKMLTRYVAELYFRLPRNDNPRSALRNLIRSDLDIDTTTAAFCPARPTKIESC